MSINRVIISGNLTRDAELRSTSSGMSVMSFGVAVNDRRKDPQTGEWGDVPNFIDCTMFGSRGERLAQYLTKGTKVCIEGKLRWNQWERDGQKRNKIEVIVEELEFMSSRNAGNDNDQYQAPRSGSSYSSFTAPANSAPQIIDATSSVYDDDIPF